MTGAGGQNRTATMSKDIPSWPADAQRVLEQQFGFRSFLEGQAEALQAALGGQDALVIMPTGSGKSLCYQLAALLMDGLTVVVSPLIALMKDQVDSLTARGLPATFINSSLAADEMQRRLQQMSAGAYRLVYVAPERFRSAPFSERLAAMKIALLAIDEAHCISQWGHDFRPDYVRLGKVVQEFPGARVMALTATATPDVRVDIIRQLGLGLNGRPEPRTFVFGFARPNLRLVVSRCADHAVKLRRVNEVVGAWKTGIIYGGTRRQVESIAGELSAGGIPCRYYHAGLEDADRSRVQEEFMQGRAPVVAATNAFGMGIDRPDIRFVLHWDTPGSVEAYYQEVGRAGRDGEEALCELLFNYADVGLQEFFIEGANPSRGEIRAVWEAVQTACRTGPVTLSISGWAGRVVGVRSDMAVGSALAALERAGLIHREVPPGVRAYATALVPGADPAALEAEFERLGEKRRRDERKLRAMLRYVDAPGCRHAYLLNYFGERTAEEHCRACDNCRAIRHLARRPPTDAEWVVVQKVLSCVGRMNGRFGRGRVAQVLIGSRQQPVLEAGLDQLSTYGLLKDCGETYVREVIDELVRDGSIRVADGEYPTVSLSDRGREVIWKKATPRLVWPEPRRPAAPKKKRSRLLAREGARAVDPALFEALRQWRLRVAKERKVPAYVICHDTTLAELAAIKPQTLADLEAVTGMGPSRVAQYGDDLLQCVDEHPDPGAAAPPGAEKKGLAPADAGEGPS
jgi:ATP-dependent DNA helicase RecQ